MPIAFELAGTISGAEGGPNVLSNPTSLQFGPDGRLYVSEQNGSINAFTVELQGDTWVATSHEQLVDGDGLEIVKNIQNHNDDGSENGSGNRQVTGIVVTGTEEEPVLYISSSDPRIASNGEVNLDTNSGVVTRASWNSTTSEWEVVDLVRGLPRSEENHAVNGMLLSEDGTKLLLQVGGFTNNGAPSGFFSYTNEYALSAAILELDLTALDALPDQIDPDAGQDNTPRAYKYDLPTLDDPNIANVTDGVGEDEFGMDEDGPWGGNDGLNMAILPADAPLRLFADGLRNAYDLARAPNGNIYTVDNGSNGGLGGAPATEAADEDGDGIPNEAIGTPATGSFGEGEPLLQIVEGGYYYHANPVRSNQNQSWTVYDDDGNPDTNVGVNFVPDISALVPASVTIADGFLIDPSKFAGLEGLDPDDPADRAIIDARLALSGITIDSDNLEQFDPDGPGLGQQVIEILGSSTNGIMVYDSGGAAFAGTIDGAIFVTQFNDNITLLNINDAGTDLEPIFEEGPDGIFGTADDVVQDADGVLFVANNSLGVPLANPLDVVQGPNGTLWTAEIGGNEITVLSPTNVIDPLAPDSDFDGILNVDDPFIRDATNGTSVTIVPNVQFLWDFDPNQDGNLPGPDGYGGGLTGVMIDGTTDFEQFFQSPRDPSDPNNSQIKLDNVKFITAAGGGTTVIEEVSQGDPFQGANSGEFLFHTGVVADPTVETLTIRWTMSNPGDALSGNFQQIGGYIGTGDQSNYLKVVAIQNSDGEIQVTLEENDSIAAGDTYLLQADDLFDVDVNDAKKLFIDLTIDLTTEEAIPVIEYETATGPNAIVTGTPIDLSGSVLLDALRSEYQVQGQTSGLAVGLFSTNTGQAVADTFQAVFQDLEITATEAEVPPVANNDTFTTQVDAALIIPVADLLANDTDGNNDPLVVTAVSNAVNGTAVLDDNGTVGDTTDDFVTFTPTAGFEGPASFTYEISDGGFTSSANVSVEVTDLAVLFRVNTAAATIAALPNDPYGSTLAWIGTGSAGAQSGTQSGFDFSVNTGNISTHDITGRDEDLPDYVPQALFAQERWDAPANPVMTYSFGGGNLASGFYTVNLFAGNGFGGTSDVGSRVFDIEIEGEEVFSDVDLVALFGHQTGGLLTWTGEITDGTIDIEWLHQVENPTVNGIEILIGAVTEPPLTLSIVGDANQTVGEGDGTVQVSLSTNRTVPIGETVDFTYTIVADTATPEGDYAPSESLTGAGTATFTGTGTIQGGSSDFQIPIDILEDMLAEGDETFTVTIVNVSPNAELGATTSSVITIVDNDTVADPPEPGDVLYRVNTGGPLIEATDGGPDWMADTGNFGAAGNSQYLVSTSTGTSTYNNNAGSSYPGNVTSAPGVPSSTPLAIFDTERYDPAVATPPLVYQFDVATDHGLQPGDQVEVRLYFAEIFGGVVGTGERVFDVSVDGVTPAAFDDIDAFADTGVGNVGTVRTYIATVDADGLLDIEFTHGIENPNIKGIEIVAVDGGVYAPPADDLFGTIVEISDDRLAPTDGGILSDGDNLVVATQEGESGANGIRDRDYFTFEVPDGKVLTGIFLDGYVNDNPTAPDGFLAIQLGDQITVDPTTGAPDAGTDPLLGAVIYGSGSVGANLLDIMAAGGIVDPSTGFSLPPFDPEILTGNISVWANQGAGPGTPSLRFVVEDAPTPPEPGAYLPNADGNFVFEAEDGYNGEGQWDLKTTADLPDGHEAPSGGLYLEANANDLGTPNGSDVLRYEFQPEEDGFVRINLLASRNPGNNPSEHNDSWVGVQLDGVTIAAIDQQGQALEPKGTLGLYKAFSSGGDGDDFIVANKNIDFVGKAIVVPVVAGETYEFLLANRSAGHEVDRIVLEFSDTAFTSPNNNATFMKNQPLSEQAVPGAVIAGRAFADTNDDAIDDGEPGIEGVTVELLDGSGSVVDTTLTLADGSYSFGDLADGTYSVRFPTALEADPLVAANVGGSDSIDSDADPVTGETAQLTVVAGDVEDNVDAGYDREVTLVGSAVLTINDGANGIEVSNFSAGSFQVVNTGEKQISAIEIDVTDALFPDAVFDPFDLAGDTTGKHLVIDSEGGTGVVIPLGGSNFDNPALEGITYFGAGGSSGYEKIRIEFSDFQPGETLGFSIDMDPNSIAGALKSTLDSGAPLAGAGVWDVGGISGGELIGSSFTVEYADASTSVGQLQGQGQGQQMGASALSTQASDGLDVVLTVNGLGEGAEGTYGAGGPQILIQGAAGEIARVLVSKGFIVPFTNEFTTAYAATLDAQLQALEASGFPANNAVEMLYVDVPLDGTVQDISSLFDFTQVVGFDLSVPDATNEFGVLEEDKLPLGIVASVIDPATDLPKGAVTSPIHLQFSETVADIVLSPVTAEVVESGDTGTTTLLEVEAQVQLGAEGTYEAVLSLGGAEVAVLEVALATGVNAFSFDAPNDNEDNGTDLATVTLREVGGGASVPAVPAVFSIVEDDGPTLGQTLLRINAFGPELPTLDSGPDWLADTQATPISYFTSGDGSASTNRGDVIAPGALSLDPDLPAGTPSELFEQTRSSNAPIVYSIPVTDIPSASGEYQVNLYFAESAFGPGSRVFDIQIEGVVPQNLDNLDVAALFGTATGGVVSTNAVVTDGELNIEFLTGGLSGPGGVQNPIISGIEIIELVEEIDPEADLSVTKTASDLTPDFGDEIEFTITVSNDGPDAATNVSLADVLGSGFEVVTSAASSGTYDAQSGIWTLASIAPDATETLTVTAAILEGTATPDTVVYRVNPGGDSTFVVGDPDSVDASEPDWVFDNPQLPQQNAGFTSGTFAPGVTLTGGNEFGNEGGPAIVDITGLPVGSAAVAKLFETERFGTQEWDFVVANGDYTVNLYFAEIFADAAGLRVFDVEIEGALVLDNYDIWLTAGGANNTALVESFDATVTDGNLDIDFTTVQDNAKISAIEIIAKGTPAPVLDYGTSVEVVSVDQDDPDSTPDDGAGDDFAEVTVTPVAGGVNEVTIAVASDAAEPATNGGFIVSLEEAAATDTDVTYTVAGSATAGTDYVALTGTLTIPAGDLSAPIDLTLLDDLEIEGDEDVVVTLTGVTGDANLALGATADATLVIADDDVANEVSVTVTQDAAEPDQNGIFTVTLAQAAGTDTEIAYSVSGTATDGTDYEALSGTVTILAGELSAPIDVTVIDDLDTEGPEDIVVTLDAVTAGDANVVLGTQFQTTMILTEDEVLPINGSALIEVTPGGNLGSSTFGGTSAFQITNTGASTDANITSISLNLATGILPDMVFDPDGSGGDATAQGFSPDAASATATGLVPFLDNDVDPFSQPRNGGFDVISMTFTDFNPGETFTFSVDIDPNSIQGVPGAGAAGAVSGYELTGSTVTLTFDDGTTQEVATSSLFEDGSLGGAQSVAQTQLTAGTLLPAPTISLEGVNGDASAGLPGQQAYVADGAVDQVVRVTGAPNTTVTLLQMDARLFIASGDAPFDVQPDEAPFYANEAVSGKTLYTGTLDANGEALIQISLLETPSGDTTPDGGLNHFVAVLSDGPYVPGQAISLTSNTLVVSQAPIVDVGIVALADAAEPATNGQFQATLAEASAIDTIVAYTVNVASTATPDADYVALSETVTILAGETSATIDVTVLDDLEIEGDETVIVELTEVTSSDGRAVIGAQSSATVTITSDDVVVPEADLSLTKTVSDSTPAFGETVTFQIDVTNDGPDLAGGITVADLMGDGFSFASAMASVGTFDDVSGVWTLGSLDAGATETLSIEAVVLEAAATADEVIYRVNPGSDGPDVVVGAPDNVDASEPDWIVDPAPGNLNGNANNLPTTANFAPGITVTGGQEFPGGGNPSGPMIDLSLLPAGTAAVEQIFRTERFGVPIKNLTNPIFNGEQPSMEWDFAVDNGDYTVNLYFAEIFADAAGERVFDVEIEDTLVLEAYDIFVAAGNANLTAVVESLDVTVVDGNLDIDFTTLVDNAKISAIEIIKKGGPGTPLDYATSAEILTSDTLDPDSTPGNGVLGEDDDATLTVSPSTGGGNDAPIITSADTFEFVEGTAGPVFTVTADDPDFDPVGFGLGTDGDEALFAIDENTGEITLTAPPTFVIDGEIDTLAEVVQTLSITVLASDGEDTTSQVVTVEYLKDTDGDKVADRIDNAIFVGNPNQRDSDGDGYGNIIDADLNNDGFVLLEDLAEFRDDFGLTGPVPGPADGFDSDFDGDGVVLLGDLAIFKAQFGQSLEGSSYIDLL